MKITREKLKQIIKEELETVLEFDFDKFDAEEAEIASVSDKRDFRDDAAKILERFKLLGQYKDSLLNYGSDDYSYIIKNKAQFRTLSGQWAKRHFALEKLLPDNMELIAAGKPPLGTPKAPSEEQQGLNEKNHVNTASMRASLIQASTIGHELIEHIGKYTNVDFKAAPFSGSEFSNKFYSPALVDFITKYVTLLNEAFTRVGSEGKDYPIFRDGRDYKSATMFAKLIERNNLMKGK
jgi:hypothetical protein